MSKAAIKAKDKVEYKGIGRMSSGAKANENVKTEVKRNGKGEMKTLGLSAAEGIDILRSMEESNMRGS